MSDPRKTLTIEDVKIIATHVALTVLAQKELHKRLEFLDHYSRQLPRLEINLQDIREELSVLRLSLKTATDRRDIRRLERLVGQTEYKISIQENRLERDYSEYVVKLELLQSSPVEVAQAPLSDPLPQHLVDFAEVARTKNAQFLAAHQSETSDPQPDFQAPERAVQDLQSNRF